ncbi:MAG: LPS export ABC transporter periplasmic protein LptC [Bacteroidetes bacterium]|jgi:LPS export ABC transporter protein LptC|nr:LPS export ABC transporter periplasmic protein LptC [Bacteroidota bacterium]MBT6686492.1 LPS export ABC transporter periplasmic protein LptC [Bacteroidota bacterium]MBT7143334.1 LPS export ABC transporter periplasmic protein LptC [Bacteroidota bacterium]MBT7491550.1 LPS export ABC transporter periplasmic protein LptC [Bacteroidota bacterium]
MTIFSLIELLKKFRFFIILIFVGFLFSCENDIEEIKLLTNTDSLPIQSVKDSEIIFTDSSILKMKMISPRIKRYDNNVNPYLEFPEGIEVIFYDKWKNESSSLRANYAIYLERRDLWQARENVVVVNTSGDTIKTEQLFWDKRKKITYSDKYVEIITEDEITFGEGFQADQNFDYWTIRKTKSIINLKE